MAEHTWTEEREYNVPLRREWLKAPRYKRAKKAVTALREFILKHMKASTVHIGPFLNEYIWKHGMKNPPHHVKVKTKRNEEGIAVVELSGKTLPDIEKAKEAVDKSKVKSVLEKLAGEKIAGKLIGKEEKKEEPKVEEKKEEPKVEEKPKEEPKVEEKKEEVPEKHPKVAEPKFPKEKDNHPPKEAAAPKKTPEADKTEKLN